MIRRAMARNDLISASMITIEGLRYRRKCAVATKMISADYLEYSIANQYMRTYAANSWRRVIWCGTRGSPADKF